MFGKRQGSASDSSVQILPNRYTFIVVVVVVFFLQAFVKRRLLPEAMTCLSGNFM